MISVRNYASLQTEKLLLENSYLFNKSSENIVALLELLLRRRTMKTNQVNLSVFKLYSLSILVSILFLPGVGLAASNIPSSNVPQPTPTSTLSDPQRKEVERVVEEAIKQERETLHDRVQEEVDQNFQWAITLLNLLLLVITAFPLIATVFLWHLRRGIIYNISSQIQDDLEDKIKSQRNGFEEVIYNTKSEAIREASQSLEALYEIASIFKKFDIVVPPFINGLSQLEAEQRNNIKNLSGELESLIAEHPEVRLTVKQYIKRGDVLYFDGNYASAIASYEKALEEKPDDYEVLYKKGTALSKLERYQEAIMAYEKALNIAPDDNWIWGRWGDTVLQLNIPIKQVMASYDDAVSICPHDYHHWYVRGNAWASLREPVKAIEDYTEAIKRCPKSDDICASIYHSRGIVNSLIGRHDKAIEDYEKALDIKQNYKWAFNSLGHEKAHFKQYVEAIECYTQAIKIDPNDSLFLISRGNTWMCLGRYEDALEDYTRSLYILPSYEAAYGQGNALTALKHYREAILSYNKALKLEPNAAWGWHSLGDALRKNHDFDRAISSYDKALEIANKAKSWYKRGKALLQLKKYQEAVDSFNKAITLNAKDNIEEDRESLLSNRAFALIQLGRDEESKADFEAALAICNHALKQNPNDGKALYEKARCYILQNNIKLSEKSLKDAIDSKPECRKWAEADLEFEKFHCLSGELTISV